jgi:hypothetical protein
MTQAVLAAIGITVLAVFFFLAEGDSLADGHARVRTQLLNTTRWAFVIALSWILIPTATSQAGPQRAATILGLALLIGALMLVPVKWFIRLGGREHVWELRRAKLEMAQLANRIKRGRGEVPVVWLQDLMERIRLVRIPRTAELSDLMIAELEDLIAGSETWNEAGRRSIRIDELSRELWPGELPPPDFDANEATFRWRLYRTFGRMIELGGADAGRHSRETFRKLRDSLEEFRGDDTYRFIDAVQQSADRWLADRAASRAWIASYDFETLGPDGLAEIKKLWGREAAMWGAILDEADRKAINEDLARRARARLETHRRLAEPEGAPG